MSRPLKQLFIRFFKEIVHSLLSVGSLSRVKLCLDYKLPFSFVLLISFKNQVVFWYINYKYPFENLSFLLVHWEGGKRLLLSNTWCIDALWKVILLLLPSKVHPIFSYTSIYEILRIFDQGVRYCTHCVRLYGSIWSHNDLKNLFFHHYQICPKYVI